MLVGPELKVLWSIAKNKKEVARLKEGEENW